MKQILPVLLLMSAFLAACGPTATPEPTVDLNATINAMSMTMAAGTLTAQPTNTPLPTGTPTLTPLPTPTGTPFPTLTFTPTITPTVQVYEGCFAPAGVGNTPTGLFRMENNTKEELRVNLNGVSFNGNVAVNCAYIVNLSYNVEIIWANYNYHVQIGNKRTISGTFMINNSDKTTMRVYDKKVVVVGP